MSSFAGLHYVAENFDRCCKNRSDAAWLLAQRDLADARTIITWQDRNLLILEPNPKLVAPAPRCLLELGAELHFLGVSLDEIPWFCLDLTELDKEAAHALAANLAPGAEFVELRRVGALLPQQEGALLAYAKGLAYWHRRHRFCGVCGGPTCVEQVGHQRRCVRESCAAVHFPRVDPAVIMLVVDRDRCLLGRQAAWASGMMSAMAGFVEPGESLEQAVMREVKEETGIEVGDIRYFSSQPWLFPSSLMVGFFARATGGSLQIDPEELQEASWYSAAEIGNFAALGKSLPRTDSIARRLIETWLNRQASL